MLLEYLKQLHSIEWENFVKDTKIFMEESAMFNPFAKNTKIDNLPSYLISFKNAAPEFTLRTGIWASLCSQTLYRTVSGVSRESWGCRIVWHQHRWSRALLSTQVAPHSPSSSIESFNIFLPSCPGFPMVFDRPVTTFSPLSWFMQCLCLTIVIPCVSFSLK